MGAFSSVRFCVIVYSMLSFRWFVVVTVFVVLVVIAFAVVVVAVIVRRAMNSRKSTYRYGHDRKARS